MYKQLDAETLTTLVRECVTIVKPGETLIIRVPTSWTPDQAEEYQERAQRAVRAYAPGVQVLVLAADELAITGPTLNEQRAAQGLPPVELAGIDGQPVSAP